MPSKERKPEGFDRVFDLIGGGGNFQWLLFCICSLQSITICYHHVGYVFLGAVPDHWCQLDDFKNSSWTQEQIRNISIPKKPNEKSKWDSCSYYDLDYETILEEKDFEKAVQGINYTNLPTRSCTKWNYDTSLFELTTVSQFNLVCERRYLVATIQAMYMVGVLVGALFMGALSDNLFGRRNAVLISVCLVMVFGFAATIATSYSTFVIARFFIAIGAAGSFQNSFSLLTEFCDTKNRATFGIISSLPFAIGYMTMPAFAYYIRDWKTLQLAWSLSTLILLSYFWLLPSSARWLGMNGRYEEAVVILNRIARINRKPKPHRLELNVILESCKNERIAGGRSNESSLQLIWRTVKNVGIGYVSLVRTPELRRRSFLLWLIIIAVNTVYYGLSFGTAFITSDPFFLVFLGGLMEVPGYLIVVPFTRIVGRIPTICTTFLITGIVCIIVGFTPNESRFVRVFFSMTGKLFISGCFAVVYLLKAELYPTSERTTGLGCAVLVGRIGSISAPYIVDLGSVFHADLPIIIFGITGIIGAFISLFLPETKNSEMFDSIKSVEKIAKTDYGTPQITKIVRRLSHPHVDPNPHTNIYLDRLDNNATKS